MQRLCNARAKVNKNQTSAMLIVEVPKETLTLLKRKTKHKGSIKRLAETAEVGRNTIPLIIQRGTAESETLQKITAALQTAA